MNYKKYYIQIFKHKKYIKFLISGFSAAMVNLIALYVFHGVIKMHIVPAVSLSFILAFFVSFGLQKFWTFADKSKDKIFRQMISYLIIGLSGLGINVAGMYLMVEVWHFFYILAQIIMSAGLAIINYFLYHLIFSKDEAPVHEKHENKKILIATGIYPPDAGGPATYTENLRKELPLRSMEVRIVTYGESEKEDATPNIDRISRQQNVLLRYIKYFHAVWREAKWADIIYIQGPVSEGLPSYFAARLRRKKYVLKIVGDFAWEQSRQRAGVEDLLDDFQNNNYSLRVELWRIVEIFIAHGAERIIVPSDYLKKIVMKWGVESDNIEVIYNSVEKINIQKSKEEARQELGLSGRLILSAGRLVPWKGYRALIEIIDELSAKIDDIKFLIAGDGPDLDELKALTLGMKQTERIIFLGKLNHEKLWNYMRAADLFVLNTGYEGLSHVLIEVMQIGLPIITTDVGGNPELIRDGESGVLVPYGDKEALKDAIAKSLDDYEISLAYAEKAKRNIEKFSKERMIESIIKQLARI